MRTLFTSICLLLLSTFSQAQNLKLEITGLKEQGQDGRFGMYEVRFKVISGAISTDGNPHKLALPLSDGKKGFLYLECYDALKAGQSTPYGMYLRALGCKPKVGQMMVSHELAPVKMPAKRQFELRSGTAFIDADPKTFFTTLGSIKGFAQKGDEVMYTNDRGQKGRGKILEFEVEGGTKTDVVFEGLPDGSVTVWLQSVDGIDFSNAVAVPDNGAPIENPQPVAAAPKAKHKTQTIPVNAVLENSEVKITVHNLVKFNPDPAQSNFDIFKVDYSLDYYIFDATVENKTSKELDAGEYLLRLNFFTRDGQSADEFLRVFKNKNNTAVGQDAEKVDTKIFGGTSKLPLAQVMVKYEDAVPDFNTKHKPATDAINKPLAPGQKVHSINATITGVPPEYVIEGIGTWGGTFFSKKNLMFAPVKR